MRNPLKRLWHWAGEQDARNAAKAKAKVTELAEAAGISVDEYETAGFRGRMEIARAVMERKTLDEYRSDLAAKKAKHEAEALAKKQAKKQAKIDPLAAERSKYLADVAAFRKESARVNRLAKDDPIEADRQAWALAPRGEELVRRGAAFQPKYGKCLRCANEHADLTYRAAATYFRCGFCGARGRWDLYQAG